MQAIILAAGMGKRLKELTRHNTKCMVKVNGVRLIDRVLTQLSRLNLKRIVIVTGYEGENLREHVGQKWNGMRVDYVDNPIFDKTNNIYSLALAADELVKDDTILLESDLIFEDSILDKLIQCPHPNVAMVDAFQSWMDGTCVTIDEEGLIKRFVPKKDFVYEEIPDYYKTVNIYKFSQSFSQEDYVPFLKAYSLALGNNEYYEQVLRVITLLEKPLMYAMPLSGEKWYEIDDIQDLDIAESMFCSPEDQIKKLASRFGGYWRYPGLIDFCYLVTPYFPCKRLRAEMMASFDVLLEQYPSGQRVNALLVAKLFGVHTSEIAVGNGAAEIIQAYMSELKGKVGFVYPTFEEYPNRVCEEQRVIYTPSQESGFRYSADELIAFFSKNTISDLIIVNPDNPSGNFMSQEQLKKLCLWCSENHVRLLIDESFADFANIPYTIINREYLNKYPCVSVMKSLSKSYGVPGLRLGVIVSADTSFIDIIKKRLSIWNINSFGEFFLQIIEKYQNEYKFGCAQLAEERERFIVELKKISFLTPFPSSANYVLCKVNSPLSTEELMLELWTKHKILIKDCSHKKGFNNEAYVRFSVRNNQDNNILLNALKEII